MNEKNGNTNGDEADDDRYVIEDVPGSVEDIEHEMEVAAQEAVDGPAAQAAQVPDDFRDRYLRTLLIHGARSMLHRVQRKRDRRSRWIGALKERRGANIAAVALANKNARLL